MKVVLLLTSCINPGNYDFVGRKGAEARHKDYLDTVIFYAQFMFPIIFIDNSNFQSKEIKDVLNGRNDSQYFCFQSKESVRGKGHGELEIIKYGLENSNIFRDASYVIKISGRYIISNFENFSKRLILNDKIHYCNFSRNLNWADTRIMIFHQSFLKDYLIPTMDSFLDERNSILFEKAYARSIHLFQYEGGKILLWPVYPLYSAVNGEDGRVIDFPFLKRIKYFFFYSMKTFFFNQTV